MNEQVHLRTMQILHRCDQVEASALLCRDNQYPRSSINSAVAELPSKRLLYRFSCFVEARWVRLSDNDTNERALNGSVGGCAR